MKHEDARNLLHAYVDGELDAATALELEAALAADPMLRDAHERLRAMSAAIREKGDYHAAPAALGRRIAASLPRPEAPMPTRRWWIPAGAFAVAALLAVGLAFLNASEMADEVFASHARTVLGGQMMQVASSDQHTVKPWLSARLPYSPPVADFAAEGFPLLGARLDYVQKRPVAVLVYGRRKHTIEAFVWPGEARARELARDGLNLRSFSRGGMTWWLVSDVSAAELDELARRLGGA